MIYKQIFFILFLFTPYINASLVSTPFVSNDLKILEELDIDTSYITDYKLQKMYKRFLNKDKRNYTTKLHNAYLFIPTIKKILKENNIPSAFLYLVMAESNFILHAKSNKKAIGLWQFMPATGKRFELKINRYIDERMDIIKSTQAAVEYLKYLHKKFGKWYIAAIAYNCGEGRVIEGIVRSTIDIYCKDQDNNCKANNEIKKYRKTIKLYQAKKVKFSKINKIYKVIKNWKYKPSIDHLLVTQRGISRQYIPKESRFYIRKIISLAMMNNSSFLIKENNSHLLNRGISDPIAVVNVKGGVRLKDIAKIIGVSSKKLHSLNRHIKRNIIPLDSNEINIYVPYSSLARFNTNIKKLKPILFQIYKVKSGDTLAAIGQRYKLSYRVIKKFNKLKSNLLSLNQRLLIPADSSILRDKIYFVKKGDSLRKISKMYKISLKKLMKDNKLKTSMIRAGEKIVVKYN
ncbi:Membrane-bound lytic murein transglycosylase D precursor [hydrothermal vent metagenome]|uniref:Membrane-bound lytic murein transglycosylase D n=1 Tax=hydrothermal vent metagenome TaxID=652676 RepID=A0A3B1E638_9ZZZZ